MESPVAGIQELYCSSYDQSKLCSLDVEFIDDPTKPLIHQTSRFLYFFKGSGTIQINGASYELKPNTMVAILPWETSEITEVHEGLQFYKLIYDVEPVSRAMRFSCNFDGEHPAFLTAMEQTPVAYPSDAEAAHISAIMLELKDELGIDSVRNPPQGRLLSDVFVSGKLSELIVRYFRIVSQPGQPQTGRDSAVPAPDNCSLILKYLYSHLSQHLTLDKVSAVVYMSKSSISKAITETTGLSFSDLLSEMRIAKAIGLLSHTDMTLNEIAGLCGFTDASHLSKVFASRIGTTANEYRKINKRATNIFREHEKGFGFDIVTYVHQNYSDPNLTIQTVMVRFGLTAQEINRILLLHVEKNFDAFLHSIRINRACEYLLTSNMSVLDIAIEVGYNNVKTFNRNFTRFKNMTPGTFKKTMTLQVGNESIAR